MSIRLTKNVASNGTYLCTLTIPKLIVNPNTKVVFTQRFINEALFSFSAIDDSELFVLTQVLILNIKQQENNYEMAVSWKEKEQAESKLSVMQEIGIRATDELAFRNKKESKWGK